MMKIPHFKGLSPYDIGHQVEFSLKELRNYSFKIAMEEKKKYQGDGANVSVNDSSTSLEVIENCFKKIMKLLSKRLVNNIWNSKSFDHLIMITNIKYKNWVEDKKFELICFNASYAFEDLLKKKIRSIILTSGTLSPLEVFAKEIGVDFKYKLVNSHVID